MTLRSTLTQLKGSTITRGKASGSRSISRGTLSHLDRGQEWLRSLLTKLSCLVDLQGGSLNNSTYLIQIQIKSIRLELSQKRSSLTRLPLFMMPVRRLCTQLTGRHLNYFHIMNREDGWKANASSDD